MILTNPRFISNSVTEYSILPKGPDHLLFERVLPSSSRNSCPIGNSLMWRSQTIQTSFLPLLLCSFGVDLSNGLKDLVHVPLSESVYNAICHHISLFFYAIVFRVKYRKYFPPGSLQQV